MAGEVGWEEVAGDGFWREETGRRGWVADRREVVTIRVRDIREGRNSFSPARVGKS
jgi:hypothetical protein